MAVGAGVGADVAVGAGVGADVAVGAGVGVDVAVGAGVGVDVAVAVGAGVGVDVAVGGMLSQAIDKTVASIPISSNKPIGRTGLRCLIGFSLSRFLASEPYYLSGYDCWQSA